MDNVSTSTVQCSSLDVAWNDWILDSTYANVHVNEEDLAAEISKLNKLAYETTAEHVLTGDQESDSSVSLAEEQTPETSKSKFDEAIDNLDEETIKLDSEIFGGYVSSVLQYPDEIQYSTVSHEDRVDNVLVRNIEDVETPNKEKKPSKPTATLDVVSVIGEGFASFPNSKHHITVQTDMCHSQHSPEAEESSSNGTDSCPKEDIEIVVQSEETKSGSSSNDRKVAVPCNNHLDAVAESYCKACDELACASCIRGQHFGHKVEPVADSIETKKQELVEMLDILTENYIPKLHQRIISNKQFSKKYDDRIGELIHEIESRETKLQTLLKDTSSANIATLQNHRKQHKETTSRIESEWDERLVNIRDLVKEGHTVCTPDKAFKVVKNLRSTLNLLDAALEELQGTIQTPTLTGSQDISVDTVTDMLGTVTIADNSSEELPQRKNLELHTTFKFAKNSIWALVTHGDGSAWIAAHEDSTIRLVTKTGVVLRSVTLSAKVYDITVNIDGNLLISAVHDSHVWQLSSNRDITRFVKFKNMFPCGLFASPKGHVFVGLVGGGLRDKNTDSRQFVVKISQKGNVLQKLEKDEEGNALYSLPYRICENINDDICVVDWTDSAEARLVVTDQTGKLNFIYNGFREEGHSFRPGGIACTPSGMILVCDIYWDIIHLLNVDGQCLKLLNSQRLGGLYGPCDISLDADGFLWVGGCKGNVQCLKYK